ncbi:MAG: class I SAM-dependent methyltransferase [Lachnospiraceae bacterium]
MEQKDIEKLKQIVEETINHNLYRLVISKPLSDKNISKISLRTVLLKKEIRFQETVYRGTQVFHENLTREEAVEKVFQYMQGTFGQLEAECVEKKVFVLTNKKGTLTTKVKYSGNECGAAATNITHNRTKNYILREGEPVDFLIDLGVMHSDGSIVKAKYDKFRQINRYLEFVRDILPTLQKAEGTLRIIDFGCGKSYLTFALYYYLHCREKLPVEIIGLDLKKDVIRSCNERKEKLNYENLHFLHGDIKDYEDPQERVDMVVSLHACDTATDFALEKAVKWGARVIFAVPCCQHELNKNMTLGQKRMMGEMEETMQSLLKYGIIRERVAALFTDAYRANVLEMMGYETQILEFIDMEHTPKNLLIRGVKQDGRKMMAGSAQKPVSSETLKQLNRALGFEPTLYRLL